MLYKGYWVHIPPTLNDVLADIGGVDKDSDFEDIVDSAVTSFFSFWTPHYITNTFAQELEKYVLNYYIMRRIGSGNVKKWKQLFRNKWRSIMPYYERILETIEKENDYFTNPILTADIHREEAVVGTLDQTQDTIHNADTVFTTSRDEDYQGSGTHTTDDDIDKTKSQSETLIHDGENTKQHTGNDTKQHSGNFSESGHSTEINRYLDTPQSVADRVWETDAQGHLKLSDYYLTDIRGITNDYTKSGTDAYTESGTNAYNESGTEDFTDTKTTQITEGETLDRDEATTNTYEKGITGRDTTDLDELGKKVTDQDTTQNTENDKLGYDGYSPADLLMRYRDTFTKTFQDIVCELEEVFYNLVEVDDLIDFV